MADVPDNRRYKDEAFTAAHRWAAVTPSDDSANNFAELPKGIYVGVAGDVAAVGADDQVATFTCAAGAILPIRPKRINSTNTDATGIVAFYGPAGQTV